MRIYTCDYKNSVVPKKIDLDAVSRDVILALRLAFIRFHLDAECCSMREPFWLASKQGSLDPLAGYPADFAKLPFVISTASHRGQPINTSIHKTTGLMVGYLCSPPRMHRIDFGRSPSFKVSTAGLQSSSPDSVPNCPIATLPKRFHPAWDLLGIQW